MTEDLDDAVAFVKASISMDGGESANAIAERLGVERTYGLIAAALAVAVEKRFGEAATVDEIGEYVSQLRERFPDTDDVVKPEVAQAVIRTARGEEGLIEEVDQDDVGTLLFFLVYAIMSEYDLGDADTTEYVNDVLAMAEN